MFGGLAGPAACLRNSFARARHEKFPPTRNADCDLVPVGRRQNHPCQTIERVGSVDQDFGLRDNKAAEARRNRWQGVLLRRQAKFQCMARNNAFLEYAEVFGHLYGTPSEPVGKAVSSGNDIVFDIDWQGGMQIRKSEFAHDTISIFVLPPSIRELEKRLRRRGKDTDTTVMSRMSEACSEISHWPQYDYVLVNRDMERVLVKVKTIIKAERLRRSRQLGLVEFVKDLNQEFEARAN